MMAAKRLTLSAALLALLPSAHAGSQAEMAQSCVAEIHRAELRIAEARKRPEYHSDLGRQTLTSADRWVNQARRHAAKGESRNCVTAAKKGREQL